MKDYMGFLRQHIGSSPLIMTGACVIIINTKNEILLHHRIESDIWGLPGGGMELGESFEETAKREVLEEVNLICNSLIFFNTYSGKEFYYKYPDGNEVYNVTAAYLCKDYSGSIRVDKAEGRDAKFFKLNEIPDNLSPTIKPILNDYFIIYNKS